MTTVEPHFLLMTLNCISVYHQLECELADLQQSPKIMFVFGIVSVFFCVIPISVFLCSLCVIVQ